MRGYLIGSGWKDYQQTGTCAASRCPRACAKPAAADLFTLDQGAAGCTTKTSLLPRPTASARSRAGGADAAISSHPCGIRRHRGIIIADTKFEFGTDAAGTMYLIDEILTPDSSRFWPASQYRVGMSPPSFDKQFVRDWLETQPWNKKAPAPRLPADIIAKTAEKYRDALRLLTA